jgi:hypothetical protein
MSETTSYPSKLHSPIVYRRDIFRRAAQDNAQRSRPWPRRLLQSENLYTKTTLVLDALDECEPDSRGRLVEVIEFLSSRSERPLKVFISSRPDRDIRRRFLDKPNIEIEATHNERDIRKFVDEEIIKHERWREMSPSLQEEIVRVLLDRSQGM